MISIRNVAYTNSVLFVWHESGTAVVRLFFFFSFITFLFFFLFLFLFFWSK